MKKYNITSKKSFPNLKKSLKGEEALTPKVKFPKIKRK
jgi:hypothetical protein